MTQTHDPLTIDRAKVLKLEADLAFARGNLSAREQYHIEQALLTAERGLDQRAAQFEELNKRFVEIEPTMSIYGPEFHGLEFDNCHCIACEAPVAGHLTTDENTGHDHGTWSAVFMDAGWNLWCEECSWDVADIVGPVIATDRREDEDCQRLTPGCCIDHQGNEACQTW